MGEVKKSWIVLINRAPRGPFSESEIRVLLSQGIIRTNDVAYLIDKSQSTSEWKFLWQFSEFDRRNGQAPRPVAEKRTPQPTVEHERKAIAEVPEELLDIRPEELVPRARHEIQTELAGARGSVTDFPEKKGNQTSGALWDNPRLVGAAAGTMVIAFAGAVFLSVRSGTETPAPETSVVTSVNSPSPSRGIAASQPMQRSETRAPARRVKQVTPPTVEPAEAPKERGEVSYDEYRKKREERIDKERQAEEKRLRQLEEGDEEEALLEDEESESPRPTSKRKRRPASRQERSEEESFDENGEELMDSDDLNQSLEDEP